MNHGIEVCESNVSFARTQLAKFLETSDAIYERDFCVPHFILGNIFSLVAPVTRPPREPIDLDEYMDASEDDRVSLVLGKLIIEPPPVVDGEYWPTYDRIYVGSEVPSSSQIEAILRLLKVGGFLIAPFNDEASYCPALFFTPSKVSRRRRVPV